MNRKIASSLMSAITLTASSIVSAGFFDDCNFCLSPYMGAEAQLRSTSYESGFGDNLYSKRFPQGNFFAGLKFCDYLGVELGYETTKKQNKTVDLPLGSVIAGEEVMAFTSWNSSVQLKGWSINLLGFLPVFENYPVSLFGSAGIAMLKGSIQTTLTQTRNRPNFDSITISKNRAVLRLTTGVQYMLIDDLGIRGSIGWENTSRFGDFLTSPGIALAKLKNSMNYGVGLFLQF